MFKTLLKENKNVVVVAGVVIAVLFAAAVLYVIFVPADKVAKNEASSIVPEQGVATLENAAIEPDDSEEGQLPPPEIETSIDDVGEEGIGEADETQNEETEGNSEGESNKEESNKEESNKEESSGGQTQYIGRQPPEGYTEPESLEYKAPWLLEYKDTYQSNIVVILEDLWAIDHRDYAWFHPLSGGTGGGYGNTFPFLAYAILTYYDGDVPCDYYFDMLKDVHNKHFKTSMIFEVQMHGDRPLNICLDMYNYKIYVEEGIVKGD